MSRAPMSMEAVLDAERKEVLALLDRSKTNRPPAPALLGTRSPSPLASARSPVRSMLDIGDDAPTPAAVQSSDPDPSAKKSPPRTAPIRSMLDVDSPPAPAVRSMLDVDSPPSSAGLKPVFSNPSSPTTSNYKAHATSHALHPNTHPRSLSDAAVRPADFGPRSSATNVDPTAGYQFSGIITSNPGQHLPKRANLTGKRSLNSAMAEALRNADMTSLKLPGDGGRHHSIAGPTIRSNKSKSPHGRLGVRSNSPHNSLLGRPLSPAGRQFLNDTQAETYDQNAYRRLSDANLVRSQGSLSEFMRGRKKSASSKGGRLTKDYLSPDGEDLPEDSSDDNGSSSDEEGERGRKPARTFESSGAGSNGKAKGVSSLSPEQTRKTQSLLAAAEEERLEVARTSKYRSLLDEPEITVTNPSGEKIKSAKHSIHPNTSFDNPPRSGSGNRTPMTSDTEADLTDIKRAQKLSFSTTQIMDYPEAHRTIQIITRGEYAKIVQEAEDEHRTPRKYLVATDLSEESTHALEWAIGTVLRDGDQLIAIYCVDEETGIIAGDNVLVPDDPKAMKEQAAAINAVTASKAPMSPGGTTMPLRPSPLSHSTEASSLTASPAPSSRERSKAEEERYRAVHDISDRVTKLLRKTRLQVRVLVEVLHCKNPRHLITEVIDIVNPTLVILGSRGRSALKGVILGSFSNYLVTKSSVPVMVARKRLRKHNKYKPAPHQVNNIHNPTARSLANAKID